MNLTKIYKELEGLSIIFATCDNVFKAISLSAPNVTIEGGKLIYRTQLDSCSLKFVMNPDVDSIDDRLKLLKKCTRINGDGTSLEFRQCKKALDYRYKSLKQSRRNKVIAQRFLNDGEKENWRSYDELFS